MLQEREVDSELGIVELTIDRPNAKNALNNVIIDSMKKTIERLEQDGKTSVVIIRGAEGNFAAGADIKEMAVASLEEVSKIVDRVHELHEQIVSSTIIFISSIEGYCLGGGLELALATDIRIAGKQSTFGLPEVSHGILPGGWGTQLFTAIAGTTNAAHYLLSGQFFDSETALRMGVISLQTDQPDEESVVIARKIAGKSRPSLQAIKQLTTKQQTEVLSTGLTKEKELFLSLFDQGEAWEGLTAFMDRRKPNFKRGQE